jgi:hypothetical protein
LVLGQGKGLTKTRLRLGDSLGLARRPFLLAQQPLALEPVGLRAHISPLADLKCRQGLGQQAPTLRDRIDVPRHLGQQRKSERS